MARVIIPKLPCEKIVTKVMGEQWRNLPDRDRDGAWGVAIIQSVVDGVKPNPGEIWNNNSCQFRLLFRILIFRKVS